MSNQCDKTVFAGVCVIVVFAFCGWVISIGASGLFEAHGFDFCTKGNATVPCSQCPPKGGAEKKCVCPATSTTNIVIANIATNAKTNSSQTILLVTILILKGIFVLAGLGTAAFLVRSLTKNED